VCLKFAPLGYHRLKNNGKYILDDGLFISVCSVINRLFGKRNFLTGFYVVENLLGQQKCHKRLDEIAKSILQSVHKRGIITGILRSELDGLFKLIFEISIALSLYKLVCIFLDKPRILFSHLCVSSCIPVPVANHF